MKSRHVDHVVFDDLVDEKSSSGRPTEEQSEKFIDFVLDRETLSRDVVVTCGRCGKRGVGSYHRWLSCRWRRLTRWARG